MNIWTRLKCVRIMTCLINFANKGIERVNTCRMCKKGGGLLILGIESSFETSHYYEKMSLLII